MSKKARAAVKVALVGASGRMGQEILELAHGAQCTVVLEIGHKGWDKAKAKDIDVVIDFSSPVGLGEALAWCVKEGKPLVSGTTGLSDKDRKAIAAAAKKIPLLYSANMSLGVAVFSEMLKALGRISDWDFQIEEAHHSQKKDRPSGTALLLQSKLEKVLGRKLPEPLSLRGGNIPGVHTVMAMGPDEGITLQHMAFNRKVFARGALHAARWLFDKKQAGLYDLGDLYI